MSYSTHPVQRRRGVATTAVRLMARFLTEHTGAREAHLIIDAEHPASRRVAEKVGAVERERWVNELGRTMVRHVLPL